ncbi:MAG: TIGR03943 family protein [Bacilli bacterium]|nr:TIGR03943 family protein [Bacilli bacterium]
MSKRYLGVICLLYSGIITYVWIFDKLKNYLAPTLQIYLKLSLIPMIFIGLVMLFNNKVHYHFKISDLILILPLILLILSNDGRLTSSFASNRTMNIKMDNKKSIKKDNQITNKKEEQESTKELEVNNEEIKEEKQAEKYDFSNVDFDIIDSVYDELSNYLTFAPMANKYEGKTIKLKGFALNDAVFLPKGYYAIGKYLISCCAADAEFTGFVIKYDGNIINDNWYDIEGVLKPGKDKDGNDIMYIEVINIKDIAKEEQYVYPCYAYDDGKCADVAKYNLEY